MRPATTVVLTLLDRRAWHRSQGAFDVAVGVGGAIDLSGIAVNRAVDVLRATGVRQGVVNAGGDLVFGEEPNRIGVRDPCDSSRLVAVVTLHNAALASSGQAIDPRTRRQVETVAGASVRAPSCMIADALTKVVGVMGEAALPVLHRYGASATLFRNGRAVCVAA